MKWIPKKGCLFVCAVQLLLGSCSGFGSNPDNMPYEPDTPAPAAHDGLFVVAEEGMSGVHVCIRARQYALQRRRNKC